MKFEKSTLFDILILSLFNYYTYLSSSWKKVLLFKSYA